MMAILNALSANSYFSISLGSFSWDLICSFEYPISPCFLYVLLSSAGTLEFEKSTISPSLCGMVLYREELLQSAQLDILKIFQAFSGNVFCLGLCV